MNNATDTQAQDSSSARETGQSSASLLSGRRVLAGTIIVFLVGGVFAAFPVRMCGCSTPKTKCLANMTGLAAVLRDYANNHAGRLPNSFADLKKDPTYAGNTWIYDCPGSKQEYIYLGGGKNLRDLEPHAVLVREAPESHQNGYFGEHAMVVLYASGQVKLLEGKFADATTSELVAGHNPPRMGSAE